MNRPLSKIRRAFLDYYRNPAKYLRMETLRPYDDGTFMIDGKSIEDVCGIERLGAGCYASVFAIDENTVLKVLNGEDRGYERYVSKVVKPLMGHNPYVPVIHYDSVWAGKRVFVMERLAESEICPAQLHPELRNMNWCDENEWHKANPDVDAACEKANNHRSNINNIFRSSLKSIAQGQSCSNPFMTFDPRLEELGHLLGEHNTIGDMHSGNVMFRGDIPVLTDPVAGGYCS